MMTVFNNVSKAGVGLAITILQTVAVLSGLELEPGSAEAAVNGLFAFVGFILLVWGQFDRKDLKYGLLRK